MAQFCLRRNARVTINDSRTPEQLEALIRDLPTQIELELGGHPVDVFTSADLVVMSPGVPQLPAMQAARDAGIEVIAEIELAYRFLNKEAILIAITGTNGKSTTTALAGTLCQRADPDSFCGGNLGNFPLIEAVDHPANKPGGYIVAEVAGFMLENCTSFRPKVAACLNITEDHLDRFGTMEVYAQAKTQVYRWQQATDFAIANAECALTVAGARASAAQVLEFSSQNQVAPGAYLAGKTLELRLDQTAESYDASLVPLIGTHNLENALAAILCARAAGVSRSAITAALPTFRGQKHRMERIAELDGVSFFDDSKGTNVAAVAASVCGFPQPVILIAGGVDKGGSYQPLWDALKGVARGLVLIGEAAKLIRASAEQYGVEAPILDATSMDQAVQIAFDLAASGDAVVLSPACSSYDMFKNFGARGMAFRYAAEKLGARRIGTW